MDGRPGPDGRDGHKGQPGFDGSDGFKGQPGDEGASVPGFPGRSGDKGQVGRPGDLGVKGLQGLPGRAEPIRAFRTEAEWNDFKDEWDRKVAEYDAFDGTCDNVIQDFEDAKEDAKDLYDETEEFFRLIESAANGVDESVRAALHQWEEDFTNESISTFQTVQVTRMLCCAVPAGMACAHWDLGWDV